MISFICLPFCDAYACILLSCIASTQDELRFCRQFDCRAPGRQLGEFSHFPNSVEVCGHRAVMNRSNEINMFWLVRCHNDHGRRWVVRDRYVAPELIAAYLVRGDMHEIEDDEALAWAR